MNKSWKLILNITLLYSLLIGCSPTDDLSDSEIPTGTEIIPTARLTSTDTPPSQQREENDPLIETQKIPVIYSHGGAPCDIGGTVYLEMHPNIDLIGTVLSRGEIHPDIAADKWATFIYTVLNAENSAIGLGSNTRMDPDSHEFPEGWRAVADNFWNLDLPAVFPEYQPLVGHELIINLVNNSPEKVTLIAMASMIDIALAIEKDPGIIGNIEHVIIMGGAFTVPGNLSDAPYPINNSVAEWNMWIDAAAAKYLFNSGVPISVVPLDAIQYLVQPEDVDTINLIADHAVDYVAQNWNDQIGAHSGGFLIWDTITTVAVTNPEFFFWTYDGIDVIAESGNTQGQTIALNNDAIHTRYATGADYQAIMDQLFETFRGETVVADPQENQDLIITQLGGIWTGFTGDFHITFVLDDLCYLDQICGTLKIDEYALTGDVTLIKVIGTRYEFKTSNLSSGQPGNPYEYLELLSDGTIKYFTQGPTTSSEAILTRLGE